jgi:hypothetical protein
MEWYGKAKCRSHLKKQKIHKKYIPENQLTGLQ